MNQCFVGAAQFHHVNVQVLKGIAHVESGFNPSAINKNKNGTYDMGLMQINSSWFPKLKQFNIPVSALYDPCTNIYIGAWILSKGMKKYGNTWQAIGAYNTVSPLLNQKYATKVYRAVLAQTN